ncbi:phage integrase SAM-like domain-containing protein [Escherichia coli]|uniref:phage integrase SAM-like domain-containing protein n=1 Tax=Escherichia coli TaxID=562 RepID=UPI0021C17DE1|nr:phage integrase SAM-like domain-containing protein [Escherichia coli]
MTALAPHLTSFLLERLKLHQQVSPNTCDTYSYAFQLLVNFASMQLNTTPSTLTIEQLNEKLILDFLTYLQRERNNTARTINSRLAAIK